VNAVPLSHEQASPRHASPAAFAAFLAAHPRAEYRRRQLAARRRFAECYPDLADWFAAPLECRVGRLGGADPIVTDVRSYEARPYLMFLGITGHARLDWPWLLAVGQLTVQELAAHARVDLGIDALVGHAVRLGYHPHAARMVVGWVVGRIVMHRGGPPNTGIAAGDLDELTEAMHAFSARPDVAVFYGSADRYQRHLQARLVWVRQVAHLLYHRGQLDTDPRPVSRRRSIAPVGSDRIIAVIDRFLAARRLTDRPATLVKLEIALRRFVTFLADAAPGIETFADVNRDHVIAFAQSLETEPTARTGRPPSVATRRGLLSALSTFFRDTAAWEWDDVPGRPLLAAGDLPKLTERVPRYIPDHELARLMTAIRTLECPYQRAALLVARWSGARRDEICRLAIDCLDRYPDGTPRLRLPAGKTRTERIVPIHDEAATAITALQAGRDGERALPDELTGTATRYLFVRRGRLLSATYLFEIPLRHACTIAGLVTDDGHPTVTAHRFRHTVGTQLAERGARLHTIMAVLGHTSATMSMTYARISDPEVLADYRAVLEPGATIAGPAADQLRTQSLPSSAVHWLQTNFFKTELELGHCLRLPQEGPCQCDLYLNCAKFVTTPAYAPRLRRRRQLELTLAADAQTRGWERDTQRHQATADHLQQLLEQLAEPVDDSNEAGP
jgi:integrase